MGEVRVGTRRQCYLVSEKTAATPKAGCSSACSVTINPIFRSGEDLALGVDLGDALQGNGVAGAAVVAAVQLGEASHAVIGVVHGDFQALIDLLHRPLLTAAILAPLVVADGHAA